MLRPEHDYLAFELSEDGLVHSLLQNRVIRYTTSYLIMAAERAVQELNVAFKENR